MSLALVISQLINGLTLGLAVFIVAAGVTLIYGILRVLNFAHGSFFMIGAYIAYSFLGQSDTPGLLLFLAVALIAGAAVGALGYLTNLGLLRRLRSMDEAMSLIATFALLLICDGLVKFVWGLNYHTVLQPELLSGMISFAELYIPTFSLFIIAAGILVFGMLEILMQRMWFGKKIRAVAIDQWMSGVLGLNVPAIFTVTVVIAFFLAGLAGGLLVPNQGLSPALAHSFLLQAFVVVIIGGLGDIRGAFCAAIILGLVDSLNSLLLPQYPGLLIYFAMILFLLWRPQGLLTQGVQMEGAHAQGVHVVPDWNLSPTTKIWIGLVVGFAAVLVPFWANSGVNFLIGLIIIEALLALSWNLLFGFTGLAIFGHAAFFALGAYVTGYALKAGELAFFPALASAAGIGAITAVLIGIVAFRRTTGIALAIMTLALGEILRVFISSSRALGSDDGLSAIPRPRIDFGLFVINLETLAAYYWFVLLASTLVGFALWWLTRSQFGRVLLCIRQDASRTEFLGINVRRFQLISFAISGAVAALAGGLYAPLVQIVSPENASYLRSVQPMLNTLLGGSDFFLGPVVGAFIFSALNYGTRTLPGISEFISGFVLLAIVLVAPSGVLGVLGQWSKRRSSSQTSAETAPASAVAEGRS